MGRLSVRLLHVCVFYLAGPYVCSGQSAHGVGQCERVAKDQCITKVKFRTWTDARDHCERVVLGGSLTTPSNETVIQNLKEVVPSGMTGAQLWVGGRLIREWSRDNSLYYFGTWDGCVEDVDSTVTFRDTQDLSECLRSCSESKYTYIKGSLCGCSNKEFDTTDQCLDPYTWTAPLDVTDHIHRFSMESGGPTNPSGCGQVRVQERRNGRYRLLKRQVLRCTSQNPFSFLCQFGRNPGEDSVKYGRYFLRTYDKRPNWDSARNMCRKETGNLAKLDWESPLLRQALFNLSSSWAWAGHRARWRFIDGSLVSAAWPDFKTDVNRGCLVWSDSEVNSAECTMDEPIPAACTLPQGMEPVPDTSGAAVGVGVGVTVGLLVAVAVILVVVWRWRKKPSSSRDPPDGGIENTAFESSLAPPIPAPRSQLNSSPAADGEDGMYASIHPDNLYETCSDTEADGVTKTGFSHAPGIVEEHKYEKLDATRVPAAHSINEEDANPPYFVLSPEEEINPDISKNKNQTTVASPYYHVLTRGRHQIPGNTNDDHFDISNTGSSRELDGSDVYNHVTGEVDASHEGNREKESAKGELN